MEKIARAKKLRVQTLGMVRQLLRKDGTKQDKDKRKDCVNIPHSSVKDGQFWGKLEKEGAIIKMTAHRINKDGDAEEIFKWKSNISGRDSYEDGYETGRRTTYSARLFTEEEYSYKKTVGQQLEA